MSRSGKLLATNDHLIEKFINDLKYKILENGTILSRVTRQGHLDDIFRACIFSVTSNGYHVLKYKGKRLHLHRIIYRKFNGPLEIDLVVNHIDKNPFNNNANNLELVTQSENAKHKYSLGSLPVAGFTRFTQEQVDDMRKMRTNGAKYSEIRKKYNISKSSLSGIINYKTHYKNTTRYKVKI